MNDVRYKWILYSIVIVILSTIGIQVYWNYKNYLNSKQQLINDVQVSLDKAVDDYYANLAEKTTFGFAFESQTPIFESPTPIKFFDKSGKLDSILDNFKNSSHVIDTSGLNLVKRKMFFKGSNLDSILEYGHSINNPETEKSQIDVITYMESDSLHTARFRTLTSKVVVSLTNDSLSLKEIDSLLKIELLRKHLNIDYSLNYKDFKDSIRTHNAFKFFNSQKDSLKEKLLLKATSESTFLPSGSSLTIHFTNETQIILKRIFGGILISLLLVLAVISSLFYLLHIIKHQKQLAEVKNDLISNITHEFKTPIATISVALESIKDFKIIEDKDKTKNYLELSSGQLTKLNVMVEKLLETATLDSDSLTLAKESINIVDLLRTLVEKHQMQIEGKTIIFSNPSDTLMASVDVFHFENAINNILDNAIKYGGNEITVAVEQNQNSFTVSISDNGNTITKAHKDKIFEKFYRIPKGNTHDIKGFGIGLYYTKKIVEKHGGTIHLNLGRKLTTFKLSFPNA